MALFDDFEEKSRFDRETEEKIREVFPLGISELLTTYGCGSFMNGYLRFINPFEYQEVIRDTYFDAENSMPFMVTAFGDIISCRKNEYIDMIQYKENDFAVIGKKSLYFYAC